MNAVRTLARVAAPGASRGGGAGDAGRGAAGVPSPCVNVCRMNADSGLCEGCARTLDEIAAWASLDDAAKRAVWQRIAQRRADGAAPNALPTGPTSSMTRAPR